MIDCPIIGKVRVTQRFGLNPVGPDGKPIYAQFGLAGHNGIDFTGEFPGVAVPIVFPFECRIIEVGNQGKKGYGKFVRIQSMAPDNNGRFKQCVFAHLSDHTSKAKAGQVGYRGDIMGHMGNTGFSKGAHLHMGLRFLDRNGKVLNYGNGFQGYVDFEPFLMFTQDQAMVSQFVKYV